MLQLKQGDCVALIAPASGQKQGQEHLVTQALEWLAGCELTVIQTPILDAQRYLASDDQRRAASLKKALTTPQVKAIFVTRGGYGCARLLPFLDDVTVPTPRFLVGFSDVTTLHLHFRQVENVIGVHGANLATELFLTDNECAQKSRQSLKNYLFNGVQHVLSPRYLCGNYAGSIDWGQPSQMTGGCLSLLVTSLGTTHEIETDGKTVMIEEVCESPYKIDRMLTHLKNAGKFDRARGVVFGDLTGCNSPSIDVLDVVIDVLGDLDCPVYHSPTFGHGALNLPWQYH